MIAPTPFFAHRGCHVRIYEEYKALEKLGHELVIVTYHLGDNPSGVRVVRIPGWIFWYRKYEAGPSWWKLILDGLLLMTAVKEYLRLKPQIIHAHLHEGMLIAWMVKKITFAKVPIVFDYQGQVAGEVVDHGFIDKKNLLIKAINWGEQVTDQKADLIITSSEQSRKALITKYDEKTIPIKYIRDGVSFSKRSSKVKVEQLRKRLKIPPDKQVVVYLGILSKYQGVDLLLKAIKRIIERYKLAHFLIMGYPRVDYYRRMTVRMGISEQVTFTGRVSYFESAEYLSLGVIAVSPKISKTEANGKLYNYLALGLPTVVFDSKLNRSILGKLGVYARYNNADDLAKKIYWLLRNPRETQKLALKLRGVSTKKYSWDEPAKEISKSYGFLVDKKTS